MLLKLSTLLLVLASFSSHSAEIDYGTVLPAGVQDGDLALSPCEIYLSGDDQSYAGDCGTLAVPENRLIAGSRLIPLPVR